jgi:sugar lactone lactonase YvrE
MAQKTIKPMKPVDAIRFFLLSIFFLVAACDEDNNPIGRTQTSGNIETFAGMGPTQFGYEGDHGLATAAKLGYITGIAVDDSDDVYFTDGAANVIRKIKESDGVISTLAGKFIGFNQTNSTPLGGDGGIATEAYLNIPLATAVDGNGNIIVADAGNNAVREILAATGNIITLAGGSGFSGYEGDGGLATQSKIWNPYSVVTDAAGNIYFADSQNNAVRLITKSTGKISTLAGLGPANGGYTGDDGPAGQAKLNSPQGIVVDSNGNVYIADTGNNVIRKISGGIITTLAGSGEEGYTGDTGLATEATFRGLKGLAVDIDNNLYIADSGNNVIRMVNAADSNISTVAGNGSAGYSGDGGHALAAQLSTPIGVAVHSKGNLYIADSQNSVIRVVLK